MAMCDQMRLASASDRGENLITSKIIHEMAVAAPRFMGGRFVFTVEALDDLDSMDALGRRSAPSVAREASDQPGLI